MSSRRAWAATVLLACVAGAVASGIFGANLTTTVFIAGAVLSLCWLLFDPWIGRHLLSRWQKPVRDPKADTELRRRSRQLGQQIAFYLASRGTNDPAYVAPWREPREGAEDQKNDAFTQHAEAVIRYMAETMDQYKVQFMGPALALFDDLLARGWVADQTRLRCEHPTNPLGIEEIVRTLQRIGEG